MMNQWAARDILMSRLYDAQLLFIEKQNTAILKHVNALPFTEFRCDSGNYLVIVK